MDDTLKMSKARLPASVRGTINRLTESFDQSSKDSINKRADGTFAKLERADSAGKKSDDT